MIFKKNYTFLNDCLNGNIFSKSFLVFVFITSFFCNTLLFISESSAVVTGYAKPNKASPPTPLSAPPAQVSSMLTNIQKPSTTSYVTNAGIKNHILYQKSGLPDVKIYTSYYPPSGTYNSNASTEHTLPPCGSNVELDSIGKDCIIRIPFDCDTASLPSGFTANEGVNCLRYRNIFGESATKKLKPQKCSGARNTNKVNCLNPLVDYCHITSGIPIIGINCKLAPCTHIPNDKYRRPGVNCMADCNQPAGKHISSDIFFIEGFNCLPSCKTLINSPKLIGVNCVLEFNDYVMPSCNNNFQNDFYLSKSSTDSRKQCLDVIDLPICSNPLDPTKEVELANCVKECNFSLTRHNINCINFDNSPSALNSYGGSINKKCHHYNDLTSLEQNPTCEKIDCHNLSHNELKNSLNQFDTTLPGFSTQKYCKTSKYSNFSVNQIFSINSSGNSNKYLKEYILPNKPCYTEGDSEEVEAILSNNFFKYDQSYPSKLDSLKNHCKSATGLDCTNEKLDPSHADFETNLLYDSASYCSYADTSQQISCAEYRLNNGRRPYDCNSKSFTSTTCLSPTDPSCSTICATGELYCFKNSLNCNNSRNSIYPVCSALTTPPARTDNEDPYVSWFFRPTLSHASFRQPSGTSDIFLVNMSGNPLSTTPLSGKPNDDLYMTMDNVGANGYISSVGTAWGGFSPSAGSDMSIRGVGTQYICGMNSDYRGIPNDEFAYIKGEVETVYELDNKISHNVEICLRYIASNDLIHSCGYRKCEVSCSGRILGFSGSCTKRCGHDVCKTLSIKEGPGVPAGGCESSSDNFNSDLSGKDCVSNFKTNEDIFSAHVRARIYKPESTSDYICAVVDFKGITTDLNHRPYFKGTEFFTVPDLEKKGSTKKLCVSGIFNSTSQSCEYGVDSNSNDANTNVWRTAKIVKYISSPVHDFDYIDQYGIGPTSLHSLHTDNETGLMVNQTIGRVNFNIKRYFETSDCIRHRSRISGPVFFSEATISDSERLFMPQIQIDKICLIATGNGDCIGDSTRDNETDFFKPAIKILWGAVDAQYPVSNIASSSSATNQKILEINNANEEKSADYTIFARNIGITTAVDLTKVVFIKKEDHGFQPKLCLYEKFGSGATLKETLIRCINRKKPKNALIEARVPLVYNQLNFNAKFTEHFSVNDPSLSPKAFEFTSIINNPKEIGALKICHEIPGQGSPLCIQREECSVLNNECVTNEKELIDARNTSPLNYQLIATKENVSNYCKNELLPRCNFKKGFALTLSSQTLNTSSAAGVGFNAPAVGNNYGWFNEVCIVKGLESLDVPVYVEALIPENGSGVGKCNRFSDDRGVCSNCDNSTNCTKGEDCCKIYSISSPDDVNKRVATPRELGFCVNINLYLKTCPAISFVDQINQSDPYFISAEHLDPVHQSHRNRHLASNHAEFDVAYEGNNGVQGKCVGFYKNKFDAIYPTANCRNSGWDILPEACKLNSCPARKLGSTNDANILGKYPPTYDTSVSEKGSLRGFNEGYANWESRDISGYEKERVTSNSCIAGYRKNGSIARKNPINAGSSALSTKISSYRTTLGANDYISSLYGTIYSYTGGDTPERKCNQLGKWEEVVNPCQRITCPPIVIEEPVEAGAVNMNDYDLAAISVRSKKVIYSLRSPFTPVGNNPTKIKITTGSSAQPARIYFNLFANSSSIASAGYYDLLIKNSDGSDASLEANKSYVLEQTVGTPNYWKIIPNPNDEVLRALWIKSGGARFTNGAFAYRSPSNLYTQDALDPNDIHEITGECNVLMGFSQIASEKPKITCDSNGNWTRLRNICISSCAEVNQSNAEDISHGFSTWDEVKNIKVGESKEVDSTGCLPSYQKYPYPPLFDSEGVRKDFLNLSTTYSTEATYDAIISSVDGANFTVNNPVQAGVDLSDSDSNEQGTYFNFKVSNAGLSSSLVSSPYSNINPLNVFYLFDNTSTLSMSAPDNNVWSKINFSSYGTPSYSDSKESKINCHSDYSKLLLASKCIGKRNCSLRLSDFETYDTLTCPAFSLGNASNGSTTTNENLGSSGGGGGGNIAGSGGGLSNPSDVNGSSGSSYYDKSFHLTPPILSDGNNKGLKVDLTSDNFSQFDGGNGSVQIEESPNSRFDPSELTTFINVGEYSHTVELNPLIRIAESDDVYVRYVLIGGGGGGGGAGLNKGTNGASGTKMSGGVFIVKRGTILKIHVGGGGKAGKTKCTRTLSNLDSQFINPAIEILEPEKETNFVVKALRGIGSLIVSEGLAENLSDQVDKGCADDNYKSYFKLKSAKFFTNSSSFWQENYLPNSNQKIIQNSKKSELISAIKNSLAKIFKKISDIFISEGYAKQICGSLDINDGDIMSTTNCSDRGWDYGTYTTRCYCPWDYETPYFIGYENGGYHGWNTGEWRVEGVTNFRTSGGGWGNNFSSFKVYKARIRFNCWRDSPYWTLWFYTDYADFNGLRCQHNDGSWHNLNDNIDQVDIEYYRDCGSSSNYTYNTCGCNDKRYWNGLSCAWNSCTLSAGAGFTSRTVYSNANTVSCNVTGYYGNATYSCPSNGATITGSGCIANSCTLNAGTGFTSRTVYGNANTVSCDVAGYSGNATYSCSSNSATINGSGCTANSCTSIATGNGYSSKAVSATETISCNTTGYTGSVTATCLTGNSVASVTGGCTCAEGYYQTARGEVCNPITCTSSGVSIGTTNTNLPYTTSTYTPKRTVNCVSPYSGTAEYTCTSASPPTSATGIFTITKACSSCVDGYRMVGGICTANSCTSITAGNGYVSKAVSGTETISCNTTGYTGTVTATCITGNSVASVTGGCTCAEGYYQTARGEVCNPITCTANGTGYRSKTGLSYTPGTSTGTFDCDEDYYGTVSYKCSGGDVLTIAATDIVSTCVKVKCPLPPNSNLTGDSVDFAKISTSYECAPGYKKQISLDFSTLQPTYTCTKNTELDKQFNPSKLITSNECDRIKCYNMGIEYDFTTTPVELNCTSPDKWGSEIYTCDERGVIVFTQNCNSVYCQVPPNENLFYEYDNFPYSGSDFININCKPGYYYKDCLAGQTSNCGRPQFNCIKPADPSNINTGVLTLTGKCLRTMCLLPSTGVDALNSSLDGTMVEWNGPGSFVNLSCKNGFYQSDPTLPPKYSCYGNNQEFGNLVTLNKCLPITCSIGAQKGILEKNNLEFGENKVINCDKSGFYGTLTYNCRALTPPTEIGTLTIISNNCTENSCTESSNNPATFARFVSTNSQPGGLGGTILSSAFLKGGQGGSTSIDFVNGSGGGGGSASMIEIDKRIIAIAGGGGGGGGGGIAENNNEAVAKTTNLDLSYTLNSNIYGKYFVGEMQFNPIQSSDPERTTGLIKAQNSSNIFNLSIPTGMYVNDIIFASFGNPTVDFAGDNLTLKKGSSCHDANSIAISEAQCLSKKTCSFNTDSSFTFLNSACRPANENFGMIASYYFQEPTLFVNKSNSVPTSSQIENLTFKLLQYDPRTSTYVPASDLINNNIYSFKLESNNTWIKNEYSNDDYFIADEASNSANEIKVEFHRTNNSFSPTLRTGAIKRTLVRPANSSLSVGFIKVGKQYILRKSGVGGSNWTIREYGDEEPNPIEDKANRKLPQRTCMTKQISSSAGVSVLWSRPNNMCTKVCPGATLNLIKPDDDKVFDEMEKYDLLNSLSQYEGSYYIAGDDRIGVGVTKHPLSDNLDYYVYWEDQALGTWQIRKLRKSEHKTRIGSNRKLLITQSSSSVNSSNYRKDSNSDDRNLSDKDFFILARKCDDSGKWETPIALCSTEGNALNPNQAPSSTGNSFFENIYDGEIGSLANKYVKQSDYHLQSKCLNDFLPQTTNHVYFTSASNIVPAPIYQCTTKSGGKVDEVYFKKVGGFDCKKYCSIESLTPDKKTALKISVSSNLNGYYVRPSGDTLDADPSKPTSIGSIDVDCSTGKLPPLNPHTNLRTSDKPKIICVRDASGNLSWVNDQFYQCSDGRRCFYSSLTPLNGSTIPGFIKATTCKYTYDTSYSTVIYPPKSNPNYYRYIGLGETCRAPRVPYKLESDYSWDSGDTNVWFSLNKYIKADHQINGLAHGASENYGGAPKCGYFNHYYGRSDWELGDWCVGFKRKYLKSYSCYDGNWNADWNNSDLYWARSCNGNGEACGIDKNNVDEDNVPAEAFLGGYSSISDKNDMFNRKMSLFPNPPPAQGQCATCIGSPPKTAEQIAAEEAAAKAKAEQDAKDLENARSLSGS